MKNTLEILHGMKSTLNTPKLNITLATRALRLGLKITLARVTQDGGRTCGAIQTTAPKCFIGDCRYVQVLVRYTYVVPVDSTRM